MKIKLNNVRLAFPQLFEAKTVNGEGKPAFSCAFLFDPKHPCVKDIKAAIDEAGTAKWGAKWPTVKKAMEAADKTCLHNGDTKSEYAGYEGNLFVNSRNYTKPTVIADKFHNGKAVYLAEDGTTWQMNEGKKLLQTDVPFGVTVPYAGCYVNASIEVWAQDNNYGKRVNATVMGVQFFKDGDAFVGGGAADGDEFDDLGDGADAEFEEQLA